MKHFFFACTLILLVSCEQDSNTVAKESSVNDGKIHPGHVEKQDSAGSESPISGKEIDSPEEVALRFIQAYVDNANKMNKAMGIDEWLNSNPWTTQNFKNEVNYMLEEALKIDPEYGLGMDPILGAQDFDDAFVLDRVEEQGEKIKYVEVRGKAWPDYKITVKVVFENGIWLVDGSGMVNIPEEK